MRGGLPPPTRRFWPRRRPPVVEYHDRTEDVAPPTYDEVLEWERTHPELEAIHAVASGDVDAARSMLPSPGPQLDHLLLHARTVDMIKLLADKGADPNAVLDGTTALQKYLNGDFVDFERRFDELMYEDAGMAIFNPDIETFVAVAPEGSDLAFSVRPGSDRSGAKILSWHYNAEVGDYADYLLRNHISEERLRSLPFNNGNLKLLQTFVNVINKVYWSYGDDARKVVAEFLDIGAQPTLADMKAALRHPISAELLAPMLAASPRPSQSDLIELYKLNEELELGPKKGRLYTYDDTLDVIRGALGVDWDELERIVNV